MNKDISIESPFTLPCGVEIPNRIVKSAMAEGMADRGHIPGERYVKLYKTWVEGKPGLLITGNVLLNENALGGPLDVVLDSEDKLDAFRKMAETTHGTGTHIWSQINHPGRQAMKGVNKEIVAPSEITVKTPLPGIFPKPRALRDEEIWDIIERFGNAALLSKKAGFHGVQIHGAHGYLVSQFLSPLTNRRTDDWGGSLENRARFVMEVYKNMRQKVGPDFPIGIKINSADFQRGGFTEEESMEVVRMLSDLAIDLIEISGGTYEKAAMMGAVSKESTMEREAYFTDYIEKARSVTDKPLLLTGGFRTRKAMDLALQGGKVDFVGIARPFCLYPHLPKEFSFNNTLPVINKPGLPSTQVL